MYIFTEDNTQGYTPDELHKVNDDLFDLLMAAVPEGCTVDRWLDDNQDAYKALQARALSDFDTAKAKGAL